MPRRPCHAIVILSSFGSVIILSITLSTVSTSSIYFIVLSSTLSKMWNQNRSSGSRSCFLYSCYTCVLHPLYLHYSVFVLYFILNARLGCFVPVPVVQSICAIVDRVLQQLPALCSSALSVALSSNARLVGGEGSVCLINCLLAVRGALSTASALYSSASETPSSENVNVAIRATNSPLERLIQLISEQVQLLGFEDASYI